MPTKSPVMVALDTQNINQAYAWADALDPRLCRLKVGKELFVAQGPSVVRALMARGFEIFLDLKFHDIPNTTAQAVLSAADMGVFMTNVHAQAGLDAMHLAARRLQDGGYKTHLIAVTLLTSMDASALMHLGIDRPIDEQVLHLARLTKEAGLAGVVASAKEAHLIKMHLGRDFLTIAPGIRMPHDDAGDQKRICTPRQALRQGADFLVMGRSITQDPDPLAKLNAVLASLETS